VPWALNVYFCRSLAVAVALHQVVYEMNKMKRLLFPNLSFVPLEAETISQVISCKETSNIGSLLRTLL
jgi:hypothetical protein